MKKGFCIAGIIIGIIMIVIGLAGSNIDAVFYGEFPDSASFGADFYTYIYGATQDTATNVAELGYYMMTAMKTVAGLLGRFIAAFGAAIVCFFGYKFGEIRESEPNRVEEKKPEEAAEAEKTEESVEVTAETSENAVEVVNEEAEAAVEEVGETVEEAEAVVEEVAETVEEAETAVEEAEAFAEEVAEEAVEKAEAVVDEA